MRLEPFRLERYFAQYEFATQYSLCSSDCESVTINDLLALEPQATEDLKRLWLGYTESPGAPTLRDEISRIYTTVHPEHVLVHSGAEEGIFLFMHAALSRGDHAVVHSPCYQSLAEVARSTGAEVSPWFARESSGWALDLDELKRLLRPSTRVIVINTPHNPTGFLMSARDFRAVAHMAAERGITLLSDEVYRESEHNPADRLPAACDIDERAVSLGVTSKTYGLPGLRIGWIATHNAELYRRMAILKDYTTICSSAPSEFLAEVALRHRDRLAQRNLDIIKHNLGLLDRFFAQNSDRLTWVHPHAGSIAFPRLVRDNVDEFCRDLVTAANVLLLPGTVFDDTNNHFRIGFGRKNLPEALARLETFLSSHSG